MNVSSKYLVVVECTDAGGFEIGIAITRMGYRPLFLLNSASYKADVSLSLQNFEFINVNTLSVNEIIKELTPLSDRIAGITTLVDSRLAITAAVAREMEISGPDAACVILKDKAIVASLAHEYSLITMEFNIGIDDVLQKVNKMFHKNTIVAKKRMGCGAVGTQFLKTEDEKINFLKDTPDLQDWILQEYFDGSLFSMEGWVSGSEINFLGWTSRRKTNNTETEFRFEGFKTIPEEITNYAQNAIKTLFARSNFKKGWFHIEFLIDSHQSRAVMIDANIGRTGGAMLPHVLAMAFSLLPFEIYQHAIEIQVFGSSNIKFEYQKSKDQSEKIYKCICFGSPVATTIEQVLLPKNPLQTSGLRIVRILGEGDLVTKIGHDDWSWIGFVAGQEELVDLYASGIQIKSNDGAIYTASF